MSTSPTRSEVAGARTFRADIIDSVDVPIVAVGGECTVVRFNPAAATLLSLAPEDLGRRLREIPLLMHVKRLEELCGDVMGGGASSQCEVRDAKNGSWFLLRIAPYMGSEQRIDGAVLTLQNITAFRASLEQAIYEREYTKAIINTVVDPLVVLDEDCRVQAANQAFYTKFQVSRDQAHGAKIFEIGNQDWEIPRLQKFLRETSAHHESDAEFEHEFPVIGQRTLLLNARRLSQGSNVGQMTLLTIQDITERKQREERLRKLSESLDAQVRARTAELEERNREVLTRAEQVRQLSWQVMRIQDEERRHIARELHDSAGQTLTVLGMNLATISKNTKRHTPEIAKSIDQVLEMVQELTKEIRTTSYLLHPPLLDENGLPAALSWYIRGLSERSGLDIAFSISEEFGRLPRDLELVVFRLVQECLTNIHRHSGSKTAAIQVNRDSDRILVEVRDQGKGIPLDKLAHIEQGISGVGIRGMRERLRQFHGEMILDSEGTGTTVIVTIPTVKNVNSGEIGRKSFESPV
jgi:PAS domain S-box-containing protein